MEKYISSQEASDLIVWVCNLSEEDKNRSLKQLTNAWVYGLRNHIDEAPLDEPAGFNEFADYWDEAYLIIEDWINIKI